MRYTRFLVITTVLFLFLNVNVTVQADEENLLYFISLTSNEEIFEAYPVLDADGYLHIFIHMINKQGYVFLHQFYNETGLQVETLETDVQEIEIITHHLYENPYVSLLYVVYSLTSSSGGKEIKRFTWTSEDSLISSIMYLEEEDIRSYMPYFDIKFKDGVMHVLYALYDRDNMSQLNVSHIVMAGLPRQEDYVISSMLDPYARFSRDILDIVIDENNDLWYIYRTDYDMFGVQQDPFGIGIAKLENNIANYTTSLDVPEVTYDIDKIKTQRGVDGLFSFMFVENRKVYWCNFNGTQIRKESQTIIYDNPIDFIYIADSENKYMLLTNLQDNGEFVTNYYGYFEAGIWSYIPIPTEKPIGLDDYNSYLDLENYLITYVTVINPSKFAPKGLEYRETSGLALKILSSNDLDTSFLMIGFTSFNPRKEFWQKNWELIAVSIVSSLVGLGLLIFLWIKSSKKIKRFFFDSQVGDYNKFILAFLNIWRVFSNFGGLIKSIWLSNKKRTILTVIGFVITGYLISSALVIAQSEESAMIKAYYRANPMISNRLATGIIDTTFFSPSEPANISTTYGNQANQELVDLYSNSHLHNYIDRIDSVFYFLSKVYSPNYTLTQDYRMTSLPDSTNDYFSSIITEGRAPQNSNEILVRGDVARLAHVEINDTFSMIASREDVGSELQDYLLPMKIVGIYERYNVAQIRKISEFLDVSNDLYSLIETSAILTLQTNFFHILSEGDRMNLNVRGVFQLFFDFQDFKITDRKAIISDQNAMQGIIYSFSFDNRASIEVSNEIETFFTNFDDYYINNISRLIAFAIPVVLLSIFMVFDVSELFSNSYNQEIEILKGRGLSTRRVTFIYLIIRLLEIVLASIISYGLALLTAIPLIRINGFIKFTNTDTQLVPGNVLAVMGIVVAVLFVISIPKIIIIAARRRRIEKQPNKIMKILKFISWRDMFFLGIGLGLFMYFLGMTLDAHQANNIAEFTTYLGYTIVGAIFSLLGGLPIAIKSLSLVWKFIGFGLWKTSKNKISFIFVEISKDIKYFENLALIFLIVSVIFTPVLVVPYSKEASLVEQSFLVNGTEISINNWDKVEGLTEEDIESIDGVVEATYARMYTLYMGTYQGMRLLVINTTEFLETMYQPPQSLLGFDWDSINLLTNNTALISKSIEDSFFAQIGWSMSFRHPDISGWVYNVYVSDIYELFPVFYDSMDVEDEAYMMVISVECFEAMEHIVENRLLTVNKLFVKTENDRAIQEVKEEIFSQNPEIITKSYLDVIESLKTPLYNVFIIEMIISLFVSVIILAYSSFTTSTKILERRIIKHDIMKKMGIKPSTIINTTVLQVLIAGIIPSLIIGLFVGLKLVPFSLQQMSYGAIPYPVTTVYPTMLLLAIFLGVPMLVFLGMTFMLRREFGKYSPTQLE